MRRALTYCAIAALFIVIQVNAAWAGKRVALLIGNSGYDHVSRLTNPKNDATVLARKFRDMGFDQVTLKLDLDTTAMRRALGQFSRDAAGADTAVIYFAGHGIEVDGANYLIPTDAKLSHVDDVDFEAIELRKLMRSLNRAKNLKLVILDACRNNPFMNNMEGVGGGRSVGRGLARVSPSGSDTLVAYASREGTIAADGEGDHSPFAQALINHVATPGLDVRLLFGRVRDDVLEATGRKQEPFTYGSLPGKRIFLAAPAPAAVASTVNSTETQRQIEELRKQLRHKDAIAEQLAELKKALAERQKSAQTIAELSKSLARQKAEIEKLKKRTTRKEQKVASLPPATTGLPDVHQSAQELYAKGKMSLLRGSPRAAVQLLRKASEKGHAGASFELGRAYERGEGVDRNLKTARSYYEKAIKEGSARASSALANLGRNSSSPGAISSATRRTAQELFAEGKIKMLRGNRSGAVRDWRAAADKGHTGALFELGRSYQYGKGVSRNTETAKSYYRKAIVGGHERAKVELERLTGPSSEARETTAEQHYENGKEWAWRRDYRAAVLEWRKASDKGHARATYELGSAYEWGRGVFKNVEIAKSLYRKSISRGGKRAKRALAKLEARQHNSTASALREVGLSGPEHFANGKLKLLRQDHFGAVADWRRAAKLGHAGAMFELGQAYGLGLGVYADPRLAADYLYKAFEAGFGDGHDHYLNKLQRMKAAVRRALQQRLQRSGLYRGAIDGKLGRGSQRALLRLSQK